MKIFIDKRNLKDSPYEPNDKYPFIFSSTDINDFVSDLTTGLPTCYLVSGYRGSGKSSFVKKVQETITDKQVIFVYSSFAKYKSHSYVLRKLIRGLYLSLLDNRNKDVYENLRATEIDRIDSDHPLTILKTAYEKTFHDVSQSSSSKVTVSKESRLELNSILFLVFIISCLISLSNIIYPWIGDNSRLIAALAFVISAIATVNKFQAVPWVRSKLKSDNSELARKSLYDEEIAEHYFIKIIEGLSRKDLKIVFVLDELDKVKADEVDNLLNELKPFLVSGLANYIIIAGQELFHKFRSADTIDDAILSSLFSRIVHVPLLTVIDFYNLFKKLLLNEEDFDELKFFADYLIFKAKRVPRKFVNVVRQKLYWEKENRPFLAVEPGDKIYKMYSMILQAIGKVDNDNIAPYFSTGSRDYLNMQLFIIAELIFTKGLDGRLFTKDDLLSKISEEESLMHLNPYMKDYTDELLLELENSEIIKIVNNASSPQTPSYELNIVNDRDENFNEDISSGDNVQSKTFNDFRNIVSVVYNQLLSFDYVQPTSSLRHMVDTLWKQKAFQGKWHQEELLRKFLEKPDDVMKGSDTWNTTVQLLKDHQVNFPELTIQVLNFLTKKVFEKEKLAVVVDTKEQDFFITSDNSKIKLITEIKYRQAEYVVKELIQQSVERLKQIEDAEGMRIHFMLIVYSFGELGELERNIFRFKQVINDEYREFHKRIHFVPVSLNNLPSIERLIRDELGDVFRKTVKTFLFSNNAVTIAHPYIDDCYYPELLQLKEYNYTVKFQVSVQVSYWRLGIQFSRDNFFPAPEIRYQERIPLIHLAKESPGNELSVLLYGEDGTNDANIKTRIRHYHGEQIMFILTTRKAETIIDIGDSNGVSILPQPFVLKDFYFAKILAWADARNPFEIEAQITRIS